MGPGPNLFAVLIWKFEMEVVEMEVQYSLSKTACAKTREKFVTVTEDCMLLGVGVISVATFILYARKWEQVKYFWVI